MCLVKLERWARTQDLIRSWAVILGAAEKPLKGVMVVVGF